MACFVFGFLWIFYGKLQLFVLMILLRELRPTLCRFSITITALCESFLFLCYVLERIFLSSAQFIINAGIFRNTADGGKVCV